MYDASASENSGTSAGGRGQGVESAALGGVVDAQEILDRRAGPLQIQVTGRGGVGKSVVAALVNAGGVTGVRVRETGGVDLPMTPEPVFDGDVVVYVLAEVPTRADLDALNRTERAVIVLGKADALEDRESAVARAQEAVGRPVYPLMGTIALGRPVDYAALRSLASARVDPSVYMSVDLLLAADLPVPVHTRRDLLDAAELWGVAHIVAALQRTPSITDAELGAQLRVQSGLDPFWTALRTAIADAEARRDLRRSAELRALADRSAQARDVVQAYLAGDEAVLAEMRAWLVVLGEGAVSAEVSGAAALREGAAWRTRAAQSADPTVQRACIAVARGYLRAATR